MKFLVGGNLLSHTLPSAVPSARVGLASGFGMGPGVSPPLSTTDTPIGVCHGRNVVLRVMELLCFWLTHLGLVWCVRYCIVDAADGVVVCVFVVFRPRVGVLKHGLLVGVLVPVTFAHHGASRSGLSTQ